MPLNKSMHKFLFYSLKKHRMDRYNETDTLGLVNAALDLMFEFIDHHILEIIHDDLYDPIYEYTHSILWEQFPNINMCEQATSVARDLIFKFHIPKRAYKSTYLRQTMDKKPVLTQAKIAKLTIQIDALKSVKQPVQRTDEWYIFRNSTLTASNICKVFVSEHTQSQLIIEKCEPININKFKTTNTESPMHWGQKFEPVSILYYEYLNETKVTDFGCIPHAAYPFMAASPDGIVCDPGSPLYGRMLEIKNVVSREITGIPKMEYWVQMQIQMEVCDLNECDFLETKFLEYADEAEYAVDEGLDGMLFKGRFLQFYKDDAPVYVYPPFVQTEVEYVKWCQVEFKKNKDEGKEFVRTVYWQLVVASCVLVLRNNLWFQHALPLISDFWTVLVEERESGAYKDRINKKQKMAREHDKAMGDFPNSGCLIHLADSTYKSTPLLVVKKSNCLIDID